jgi:hypothetical protein
MTNNLIPDDIARFVLEKIDSVAQMEALLLLRGEPKQEWGIGEVSKRLYITETQTAEVLGHLCADGILICSFSNLPKYRYQPSSPDLERMIDRVAEMYSKHLVPVTNLIHSKPVTRVQEFADAFKFRKDK